MKYVNSLIELIGDTPLIKLNKVVKGVEGTILAKVEYFNPGHSIKDRIALKMIEDAEERGLLKSGGTIVEATSGNTGMGLALVAIAKGYRCIFTLADKQSQEKTDALRAVGAEVVMCPTAVEASDPRSFYSVAKKLSEEIPNSFYPNQYDNLANTSAHYTTTGPEIWRDTDKKITHFVSGMGTGGTITGISKYLKEQNPQITSIGVDSYGSVLKKYKETGVFDEKEIFPYLMEGIGEDMLPENLNFSLLDHVLKVSDKNAALMTRTLAKEEGLFVGWSCGAAVYAGLKYAKNNLKKDDVMVILLPDHGTRYLSKVYSDKWMQTHGFLSGQRFQQVNKILDHETSSLICLQENQTINEAVELIKLKGIDQIPVINEHKEFIGSVSDSKILNTLLSDSGMKNKSIAEIMDDPFQFVSPNETVDVISSILTKGAKAVLVRKEDNQVHIITKSDLLTALAN